MADNPRSYTRDIRGRFTKVDPVRDVLASDLGTPQKYAYGMQPRHVPAADGVGQGDGMPPSVRTARSVSGGSEREVYATPYTRTLAGTHTDESGRPVRDEMRYLIGDVDQSAPGEATSWGRQTRIGPPDVHPDDAVHPVFGMQGAVLRTAARRAGGDLMDPTGHLVGLERGDDGR